jgi:hypothetical protein
MRCYLFWFEVALPIEDQIPRVKLTRIVIDALPTRSEDIVHWETGCPGFSVKITPKGRKILVAFVRKDARGRAGNVGDLVSVAAMACSSPFNRSAH